MKILFICLSLLLLVFTLLPRSRNSHWLIRVGEFPRFQLFVISCCLLLGIIVYLDLNHYLNIILLTISGFCAIWQLWWVIPYTPFWTREVQFTKNDDPNNNFSIIISNVYSPNRNANSLIKLVKDHQADLLITLESDQWWQDQLDVLEADMPYSVKCPLDNLYGMHLYSKLKILDQEIAFLVEEDVPSIHVSLQLRNGSQVRAHFVHPAPPSPTENSESTERDAELIVLAKSIEKSKEPIIVSGDLNDVAWSSTTRLFRKLSGLLDPRIGRGMFNTFHAKYPLLRWPLDHLFHSEHFTLRKIKRLPSIGSDHFPLLASLCYTSIRGSKQNESEIEAVANDQERAQEIRTEEDLSVKQVPKPN